MRPLLSTELAYAAGIIDGEGCIHLSRGRNTHADGTVAWNFTALVNVGSVDRVLCDWLQQRFGGTVIKSFKGKGARLEMYRWQVWSSGAQSCLEMVRPYLVIKQDQALFLLAHRALVGRDGPAVLYRASSPGNGGGHVRPDALTDMHLRIYEKIKSLNQRSTLRAA